MTHSENYICIQLITYLQLIIHQAKTIKSFKTMAIVNLILSCHLKYVIKMIHYGN